MIQYVSVFWSQVGLGFLATQVSTRQGRQFFSFVKPLQAWLQGNILSHAVFINSIHSLLRHTSLKASLLLGAGEFIISWQKRHFRDTLNFSNYSHVFPIWYGSTLHLVQKFFVQLLHLHRYLLIWTAASLRIRNKQYCERVFPSSSLSLRSTFPGTKSRILPHPH